VRDHPNGPEPAQQFMVPRGARAVVCRSCGEPVYWLVVRSRRVAVTCEPGDGPTVLADGHGVNHAPTCKRRRIDPFTSEAARKAIGRRAP
jgi:hypothetical protein